MGLFAARQAFPFLNWISRVNGNTLHADIMAALTGAVEHAQRQKQAGVDIIIAQGTEAGGHTGEIGSMVLIPDIVDAVAPTPVLGAGGIASGRQAAAAMALGAPARELGEDAIAALQSHDWPGNVRQLRNVIDWIVIMAPGDASDVIRADMLPPDFQATMPTSMVWEEGAELMGMPLRDAREMFERQYLSAQVARFGGNISRTAAFVGMERSALHRKLKSLGVNNTDRQDGPGMVG